MSDWAERTNNGTSFAGSDVQIYRAHAIASGLSLYAKTRMRINRAYTPTNMLRAAREITGQTFKRGQYLQAAQALQEWANAAKARPRTEGR